MTTFRYTQPAVITGSCLRSISERGMQSLKMALRDGAIWCHCFRKSFVVPHKERLFHARVNGKKESIRITY